MGKQKRSILDYFGVRSQSELLAFIERNPTDKKVLELKELFLAVEDDELKPVRPEVSE